MSNGKKKTASTYGTTISSKYSKAKEDYIGNISSDIIGSSPSKTKVTTYKRGTHKGQIKKIKTYTTDASGDITKHKVKYSKGKHKKGKIIEHGELKKEKIKKSKRGVLGILGAKRKAKYTKKSGVTVSQVKGKVDPTKVAKKAMTLGAVAVSGAGWPHVAEGSLRFATSTFGTKTLAGIAGATTAAMTGITAGSLPLASSIIETGAFDKNKGMRTSVKGKVSKGNVVKSEWGKMGA